MYMKSFYRPMATLLSLLVLSLILGCSYQVDSTGIYSPNNKNSIHFSIENGRMYYAVNHADTIIIEKSLLGFQLFGGVNLVDSFSLLKIDRSSFKDEWKPYWGEKSLIKNEYNEMIVYLKQNKSDAFRINLHFRAFNDGIAFRYIVPPQAFFDSIKVVDELTEFRLPGDYDSWSIPANFDSYEFLYRSTPVHELDDANTPITLRSESNLHLSIHEAHLVDYPEMTLKKLSQGRGFKCELAPRPDGLKLISGYELVSPWRSIQIAASAGDLLLSDLIVNLNPPPSGQFDWVRPYKYIGVWWDMHIGYTTWTKGRRHGATTANALRYIDFAADHDIEAVLFEGWNTGWENWGDSGAFDFVTPYPDFNIEAISAYAKERGIAIIGHHETGGDAITYEALVDSAFSFYQFHGISAVKTGYAGGIVPRGESHHGQWMVKHYRKILEKAAENKIMLNVHEPIKGTGEHRTFPNMMTREGARGMEWNAWSSGNPPSHTCILPFTRCLAGPLDYTPGIFDLLLENQKTELVDWNNKPENTRVHTTLAKQLALMLVIYSPMQMAADIIDNYENHPAFEWIKKLPVSFDESLILDASIGEYLNLARRLEEDWFIGGITNEEERTWTLNFQYLMENETYQAIRYLDAPDANWLNNPTSYIIDTLEVNSVSSMQINLAPGGGFAIRLSPL